VADIDQRWDNLKQTREAGWKSLPKHPDIDPAHEALLLAEHFRETARLKEAAERPSEFRRWLSEAESKTTELQGALRDGKDKAVIEKAFKSAGNSCVHCHAKYRDVPASGREP
jgi:hypothetical protein